MNRTRLPLRILLVSGRAAVGATLRDTLSAAGHQIVGLMAPQDDFVVGAQRAQPDALVIELPAPTRELLHGVQMLHERQRLPIVVFADTAEERDIRVAVRSGVSAFVVDGLEPRRLAPILHAAVARFIEFEALRSERDQALARLHERRAIERAKGILMRRRDLAEAAAYEVLRKMAMNRGRRMVEVAESIITAEEALSQP